jgi:hypothetical protein
MNDETERGDSRKGRGERAECGDGYQNERRVSPFGFINARAVHGVVKYLAQLCDGAQSLDGQGFNKQDSYNGHSWARMGKLTDEQAGKARDVVRKYRRQIPEEMWRAMWH